MAVAVRPGRTVVRDTADPSCTFNLQKLKADWPHSVVFERGLALGEFAKWKTLSYLKVCDLVQDAMQIHRKASSWSEVKKNVVVW